MPDQINQPWFLRLPTDIANSAFLMDNSSAADWRVLVAIAKHQGYQNRRTFPLHIAKTAQEARCCRRQALMSIDWWVKVGVLLKAKRNRVNVYEIARHFQVPPGIGARQRHNTPRNPNRGENGRYVPLACTPKVQTKGTITVQTKGTLNQKSSSEVFIETAPSPPRGNTRPHDFGRVTLQHPASTTSKKNEEKKQPPMISVDTLKALEKTMGREGLKRYMVEKGYPLTLLPEAGPGVDQRGGPDDGPPEAGISIQSGLGVAGVQDGGPEPDEDAEEEMPGEGQDEEDADE